MDAIGDDTDTFRCNQTVAQQLIAGGLTDSDHLRSLAKAVQYLSGHGSKPAGTLLLLRMQQTTECIQIVAGYHRTLRWKDVHHLRIAMVHYVKKIEIFLAAAQPAWIIDKPVE